MISYRTRHAIRVGLRGLAAHRLRSALTTLGIVLGVASVIVMLSVGEAARSQALKQLADLGVTTVVLKSVKPTDAPASTNSRNDIMAYGLTYADLKTIRETFPSVVGATPMREFRKKAWHENHSLDVRFVSVVPGFLAQNNIPLLRGRGIEPADEERFAKVAVLGASAADALFPGLDPVGRTLSIEGLRETITFTVVGVSEDKMLSTGGDAAEFSKVLFIPFSTDRVIIGRELITIKSGYQIDRLDMSQITVTVNTMENVSATADAIRSYIDEVHKQKDVQIQVPLELLKRAEETQRMFTLILAAIAGISLVVGGIGIMNIMLASVTERTREIGVRRAMGAKRQDIANQFLVETLVLSCGGGVLGLLLGIGLAIGLRNAVDIPTTVKPWSLIAAFSVSVLVGLLSGLYPARRAARLDPIEALRHS